MLSKEIAIIADLQHGVVTHTQLREQGASARQIQHWLERSRLRPLHKEVYALGHERLTPSGRRLAAVLCFGGEAALSHRSAAAHWDLLGTRSSMIDVSAPRAKNRSPGVRLHRPRRWVAADRTVKDSVRVTTVGRTLLDLAGSVPFGVLERATNEAMIRHILDASEVCAAIDRGGRKRGVRALRTILERIDPTRPVITKSSLEAGFLRLFRAHGLREPECNVYVEGHQVDLFWRACRLVVETDGDNFHSTPLDRDRDRKRDRELELAGYLVMRFGSLDLTDTPERSVAQVRAALNSRSRAYEHSTMGST